MTKQETTQIIAVIKTAYPRYYANISADEAMDTIALWHDMLAEYPANVVSGAVKSLLATNKFPPTIAEVIERINRLTKPAELGEMEAWNLVKEAIRNSTYHAQEEFDRLPESVQRTLGSPSRLREWAVTEDYNGQMENVIASNFMRAYRAKVDDRKMVAAIPASVAALITQVEIKTIGDGKQC